eukprot:9491675-Pyramimonas_sp.AAC.1
MSIDFWCGNVTLSIAKPTNSRSPGHPGDKQGVSWHGSPIYCLLCIAAGAGVFLLLGNSQSALFVDGWGRWGRWRVTQHGRARPLELN